MLLVVGVVVRPHGVRGEVLVDVRTDEPGERFVPGSVMITDPADAGPLAIESVRSHTTGGRPRLIVGFEDVLDRDSAEALRGVALRVDTPDLGTAREPDEYHDQELVGLVAVDETGERLGDVVRVEHAPASDLLVLRRPDGRETLVPFVRAIVPRVDLRAGRVMLTPPGGLLEL
ncbi:MAG TPA: ribosome maturation factor RimM [Micromonosporaceae bacterium]|jgi:16S rRNA processing protein RimM